MHPKIYSMPSDDEIYQNIETLNHPPVIGKTYLVPCAELYEIDWEDNHFNYGYDRYELIPIIRPGHEDNKYLSVTDGDNRPNHYHVDRRFLNTSLLIVRYTETVIWQPRTCFREQPPIGLLLSSDLFKKDFENSKMNCLRCPHKGTLLNSAVVKDNVVTCPAHGLKFSVESGNCVSWEK